VKTRLAICLAFAAITPALLPAAALAQVLLPPYEVLTSVRSVGLEPIRTPARRGDRYVLRAIDRSGAQVSVVADAMSGRVLFVRPVDDGERTAYAERVYPRVYPEESVPPRGYERQPGYELRPQGNYEQRGNYDRLSQRNPREPSVIYAPRDRADVPRPPAPVPSAAKPPAPKVVAKPAAKPAAAAQAPASKVVAKPAAKPAAAAQAPASDRQPDTTTGAGASHPPEENPALAIPPVQTLE